MNLGHSPYAGDAFHQPPLILALFYHLHESPILVRSIFIICDLLIGLSLMQATYLWQQRVKLKIKAQKKKELQTDEESKFQIILSHNIPELVAIL
jgi:hypothetical protein